KIRLTGGAETNQQGCHTPPPGLAFGEPDDRLQQGIRYAEASRLIISNSGILDHRLFADDEGCGQSPLGGDSGCTISRNGGSASQRAACAAKVGWHAASNSCGCASVVKRSTQATAMSACPMRSPNQNGVATAAR